MSLSYDEIKKKIEQYNKLKTKYNDLVKKAPKDHFVSNIKKIKKLIDEKDLLKIDILQQELIELNENIEEYWNKKRIEHIRQQIEMITKLVPNYDSTSLLNKVKEIKDKGKFEHLDHLEKTVKLKLKHAKKYDTYKEKITEFSDHPTIEEKLTNELNESLHSNDEIIFDTLKRSILTYNLIINEFRNLKNQIIKKAENLNLKDLTILKELDNNFDESITSKNKKYFNQIKEKINFINKNGNEIKRLLNETKKLNVLFSDRPKWMKLIELKRSFEETWDKETFTQLKDELDNFLSKKNEYQHMHQQLKNEIQQLEQEQNITCTQEHSILEKLEKNYNPSELNTLKKQIQQKKKKLDILSEFNENKQDLIEKKRRLIDKTINEPISHKAVSLAMKNINKRIDEITKQIQKHKEQLKDS